jgi:putative phage-type endonuclease
MFQIIDLEQGSTEWMTWRATGIGSSDASTIMGQNPWKTEGDLTHEKLTIKLTSAPNAAMQRGTELEPMARAYYEDKTKVDVIPHCLQSNEYPWMKASLDGINIERNVAVEIKCGEGIYKSAFRMGCPPEYCYPQLQHILAVTGYETMDFWCYSPGKRPVLQKVPRNERYINRLIKLEEEFWRYIEPGVKKRLAVINGD